MLFLKIGLGNYVKLQLIQIESLGSKRKWCQVLVHLLLDFRVDSQHRPFSMAATKSHMVIYFYVQ